MYHSRISEDVKMWIIFGICVLFLVVLPITGCLSQYNQQTACNQQGGVYVKQALNYTCVKLK